MNEYQRRLKKKICSKPRWGKKKCFEFFQLAIACGLVKWKDQSVERSVMLAENFEQLTYL